MTFWAIILIAAAVGLAICWLVLRQHRDTARLRGMREEADAKRYSF